MRNVLGVMEEQMPCTMAEGEGEVGVGGDALGAAGGIDWSWRLAHQFSR